MLGPRNEGMSSSLHFLLRRATSGPKSPAGCGQSVWVDQHAMSKYWNPGSRRDNEKEGADKSGKQHYWIQTNDKCQIYGCKKLTKCNINIYEVFKRQSVWHLEKKKLWTNNLETVPCLLKSAVLWLDEKSPYSKVEVKSSKHSHDALWSKKKIPWL